MVWLYHHIIFNFKYSTVNLFFFFFFFFCCECLKRGYLDKDGDSEDDQKLLWSMCMRKKKKKWKRNSNVSIKYQSNLI